MNDQREPDKPAGAQKHPPEENPERGGPEDDAEDQPSTKVPPATGEPAPESAPGEAGVTSPRR
jgi:hypothetical protein